MVRVQDMKLLERRRYFLWLIITASTVFGALIEKPQDVVAVVGSRVEIKCSTDLPHPVKWTRLSPGADSQTDIYHGRGVLTPPFIDRFTIALYNLVIRSVTYDDAGEYTCIDDSGFGLDKGHFSSAQLTVIGKSMECQHNIVESLWYSDSNCADIASISMTCTINSTGSAPAANWHQHFINGKITAIAGISKNFRTYSTSSVRVSLTGRLNQSSFSFSIENVLSQNGRGSLNITRRSPDILLKSLPERKTIQRSSSNMKCLNEKNNCKFIWRGIDGHVISEANELITSETNETDIITCTAYCPLLETACNKTLLVITPAYPGDSGTLSAFFMLTHIPWIVIISLILWFKRHRIRIWCKNSICSGKSKLTALDYAKKSRDYEIEPGSWSTIVVPEALVHLEADDNSLAMNSSEDIALKKLTDHLHGTSIPYYLSSSCFLKPKNLNIYSDSDLTTDVTDDEGRASEMSPRIDDDVVKKRTPDDNHESAALWSKDKPSCVVDQPNDEIYSEMEEPHDDNDCDTNDSNRKDKAITRLNLTSDGEKDVVGVASFLDKLYILCRNSKKLICFKSKKRYDRDEENDIIIPGLVNPGDMVVSKVHKCLYVSEKNSRYVYKINESEHILNIVTKQNKSDLLSVTFKGDLLVTDRSNRIYLYNSNGHITQFLSIPLNYRRVFQAVQFSENQYLLNCKTDLGYVLYIIDVSQNDKKIKEKLYKSQSEEAHVTVLASSMGYVIVSCNVLTVRSGDLNEMNLDDRLKSLKARRSCSIDEDRLLIGCSDGAYVVNISDLL